MEAFDQLAELYQGEHSHNPFQAAAIKRIDSLVPLTAPVLDLGCGTGVPTAQTLTATGRRVVGVDISQGMLALARAQVPTAEFVHADVRDLPADFGRFGGVTAFFSLLMLSRAEIEKTLIAIKGWLQPGGWFALSMVDMDTDSLPVEFLGVPVFVTGYPQDQLAAKLTGAGFRVESIKTVQFTPAGTPPESQIFALCQLPA